MQAPAAKPEQSSEPLPLDERFKADAEVYGEDLIAAAQRWSQPLIDKLQRKITELESRVGGVNQAQTQINRTMAHASVESHLDEAVPNWRAINEAPEFFAWLDAPDPFSGTRRHNMMATAYDQGQGPRVSAFFRAFAQEHTAQPAAPRAASAHTPAQAGAGPVPLDTLAAPGRSRQVAPGAPSEKRIFTKAEITAFYRDKTAGRYAHDPARAAQIEAAIFDASREGRVR